MISAHIRKSFTDLCRRNASSTSLAQHSLFSSSTEKRKDSPNSESAAASFLKEFGLSDAQVESALKRRTQLRTANPEKSLMPKIKAFRDFGFSNSEIAEIISRRPSVLCCSVRNIIIPSLSFLKESLGSHDRVLRAVKRLWWFLSIEKTIKPNINLLNTSGVPMDQILCLFRVHPNYLCTSRESISRSIAKLEALGMDPSSKKYIHGFRVVNSLSDKLLERKMQAFKDLGFTETEILYIFKKAPYALSTSIEKIKNVTEMVLSTEKYDKAGIVTHGNIFLCSIEKKLKPRIQVLQILEHMDLIKKWPSLGIVAYYSGMRFFDNFVSPHVNRLDEAYAVKLKSVMTAKL